MTLYLVDGRFEKEKSGETGVEVGEIVDEFFLKAL